MFPFVFLTFFEHNNSKVKKKICNICPKKSVKLYDDVIWRKILWRKIMWIWKKAQNVSMVFYKGLSFGLLQDKTDPFCRKIVVLHNHERVLFSTRKITMRFFCDFVCVERCSLLWPLEIASQCIQVRMIFINTFILQRILVILQLRVEMMWIQSCLIKC